jgi:hypothetical protein
MIDIEMLEEAADEAGVEYRTDYSGRGMYGATCFAIEGKTSDLIRFLRQLPDEVGDELVDPSTDSMGLDIVFYWPYKLRTKESSFL